MSSHLTEADLERLRHALVRRREALIAAQRASAGEQRGITDAVIEDGDVAERMIEQEGALRIAAFDEALLGEIDRALAKLDAGTYGVSEDSGEPIPLERLESVPWARRLVTEEERRPRR